jgi:glycosyltransferase 2 family protein
MGSAPSLPPFESAAVPAMPIAGAGNGRRLLILKAAITFALLGYLMSKLEWSGLETKLRAAALAPLGAALAIIIAEIPMVALRWMWLARCTGAHMTYRLALQLTFAGLFFGQVLPASIGGDVVRGWLATRNGLTWQPVVTSLIVDRLIALLAAVILICAALPWIGRQGDTPLQLTAQLSVAVVLALIVGLFADRLPLPARVKTHRVGQMICALIAQMRASLLSVTGAGAMALSLLIHAMTIFAVTAIAASLGLSDLLTASAIIVPIALVAAAVPISVNGWGVREGVMVAGFALFGIAQADAFLISVLLGFTVVLSALPGGFAWLVLR